jgi:acetone carboxylase gamma subunit
MRATSIDYETSDLCQIFCGFREEICPHCGQLMEVDADERSSDVVCTGCGQSLSE